MVRAWTREEVARHSSAADNHVIIDNNVYDLTKFASIHPGGERFLHELAGKDVTKDFYQLHRKEVLDKLGDKLLVGTLNCADPKDDVEPLLSRVPFAEAMWNREAHASPYYTDSHRRFQQSVRAFLREIRPEADACETEGRVPSPEMFRRLGDFGLLACRIGPLAMKLLPGIALPGGVRPDEFDYFHEQIAHEEMGALGTPAYHDGLGGGMVIGLPPVLVFGRPELAQRVGREVLSGRKQIALAISEPFAGSDVAGIRTSATRSADGKYYVVNGVKKWITNGVFAHYFVTAVRTGGDGMRGMSLLLIERGEGLSTEQIKVMYGSAAGTALVTFDNVRVPVDNILGKGEGDGFRCVMFNFNHERWLINAGVIRGTRAMLEECFKWAHQRETFGDKLTDKPVIRAKLARMAAAVEAAHAWLEALTFQMTRMTYEEQVANLAGPIALHKLLTTRTATMVADEAAQIFGGRALTQTGMGRFCERFWRSVKFGAILGGSEEIMADLGIKQALKQFPAHSRL